MNEFVEQFLLESRELVEQATADLLALEENPGDMDRLDSAFRAFHTLKGSAGIVDFAAMARAAHAAEDLLAAVRAGKMQIARDLVNKCLACLDQFGLWLDAMQKDGEVPSGADAEADAIAAKFAAKPQNDGKAAPIASVNGFSSTAAAILEAQLLLLNVSDADGFTGRLLAAARVAANVLRASARSDAVADVERTGNEAAAMSDAAPLVRALTALLGGERKSSGVEGGRPVADAATARVLRVDIDRIDALVKLAGELGVAKNAIGYAARLAQSDADPQKLAQILKEQHEQIGRLVDALQQSVLGIRVLPLRNVFNRFPKLVREIAEDLGKAVKLVTEGEDTEADKVIVESLFDPLLHVIRNALDHGIESADKRAEQGKSSVAVISLRAFRNGDSVVVDIEDDGRGIDLDRVRRLSVERGLLAPDAADAMTDDEAADLIFAAGFSTAATVTDLSGRGVGMNVVRNNVERLGGSVRVNTRSGRGTTVTMILPFSVMMTRAMTVEVGGQAFGLPLDNVVETARVPRERISGIGQAKAFVLRERTVPLISLAETLGMARGKKPDADANIVVLSVGGHLCGLEVESFGERLDVMLRPMEGLLQGMPGIAGTSLLGTGGVLIVLNPQDLIL